jgi:uncharacterized membrane protein YkvA (DUF1232 family)
MERALESGKPGGAMASKKPEATTSETTRARREATQPKRTRRTRASGDAEAKAREKKARKAPRSKDFEEVRNRAERVLRDPEAATKLADAAEKKADGKKGGALTEIITETKALIRLVRAYVKNEYRAVSWESMVLVVGALTYLVSPLDLIPDFLPGGLIDDAAVVAFVLGLVRVELLDFMEWETTQEP